MFTHLLSVLLTVGTLFSNPAYTPLSDLPSTDDVHKLETAISGNTLHATWYEGYSSSARRYYRRSTDLGATWEAPIEMEEDSYYMSGCTNNFCVTPEGYVHILSNDHSGHLIRHFSSDNGATFIVDTLYDGGQYGSYQTVIKAKDNKVAIACNCKPIAAAPWQLHILYSDDYGVTFRDTLAQAPDLSYFMDMYLTDSRITIAYRYEDWYSTLNDGRIYVSTADITEDGLTNLQHHLVNPQLSNGTYKCMYASESELYTPCLIDDNGTLHMTFYGQVTDSIAHSEDWHTIYTQSTDGGQTWRTPVVLRGNNKHPYPAMIAKNGHIYILARDRKFFYSHDNGATWSETDILNMDGGVGLSGSYHLWFDPTDTDGLSVNVAGNYWTWMHTSDGFLHVDAGNTMGILSDFWAGYATFEVDAQGHRHYFLVASPRFTGHTSLVYIGEGNQPAPGNEQAWSIDIIEGQIANRAYVPASPSLNRCDSAFTVELWVKIDSLMGSNTLITRTTSQYYGYSIWNPGWGIKIDGNRLIACLSTDKSDDFRATELGYDYDNHRRATITAHTWHHVAITYDATSDQLDNFFFYVDGLLVGKASLTGVAPTDYYPIILGSDPDWRTNHIEMDNIRIWDRALSLDELRSHQPVVAGAANGLVLNLKMDGTLQDASGYHNDGMLIYSPSYADSNIDMPQPSIISSLNNKTVTCVDNTTNGNAYFWDMGDYESYYNFVQGNSAQHEYRTPGSYEIGMKAANESAAWSATRVIEFEGLSRIEPYRTGNLGWYQATIYGCDLTNDPSQIYLSNNGNRIPVDTIYSSEPGKLRVRFTMNDTPTGGYDLTVGEYTLPQSVSVIQSEERFRPEISMIGRNKLLYGKWQTYTFTVSHHNNVMMTNIPIYLFFENTPSLEVEFVNFEVVMPDVSEEAKQEIRDSIGDYLLTEINGATAGFASEDSSRTYRYYPLLIPVVYPGEAYELKVRIRSNQDVDMIYGISDSWDWSTDSPRESWEEYERRHLMDAYITHAPARIAQAPQGVGLAAGECMMKYLYRGLWGATAGAIDAYGCVVSVGFAAYDLYDDISSGAGTKKRLSNWAWNFGGAAASCVAAMSLGPVGGFIAGGVVAMVTNYHSVQDCVNQVDHNRNKVNAVGSLDPNEMIGPAGIGEDHWLLPGAAMPYTILFENKSTATAPAHVITISDTINVEHYDMSSFRFNNFGWGDTIISASQADPCQFVQDIDLRPAKPIIVRVAGAVDTISGIINWSITSLNPGTMEEEEDPDLGVLPPNDSIGSGEGFVSFFLQLKDSLPNDTRVTNRATIIFDVNAPIMTNTYVNGIDDESPLSQIAGAEEQGDSLLISLSGYDRHSGIDYYTIWTQTAGHDYEQLTTTNGENVRVAKPTEETCFFVRATDRMGWTEPKEYTCEYRFVPLADAVKQINASHSDVEKRIINGQLVIKVNGHTYNAQGTLLE